MQPRLSRVSGIKAVLFDVYGTILVARQGDVGVHSPGHVGAALAALRTAGFKPRGAAAGLRAIELLAKHIASDHSAKRRAGITHPEVEIRAIWNKTLRVLARESLVEKNRQTHAIERLSIEYECGVNPVWPMPGLGRALKALAESGIKIGIVSNAQFYTPLILEALPGTGWRQGRFDTDLTVWSFELSQAKPSSRLVRQSLRALRRKHGITPQQTLMVGNDMLNDLLPAARAGCKTALFAGDTASLRLRQNTPACVRLQPDLIVKSLGQIVPCLTIGKTA